MIIRLATEADWPTLKALVVWACEELAERFGVPRMDNLVLGAVLSGIDSGGPVAVAVDEDGDIVAWCARTTVPGLPLEHSEGVGLWVHPKMRRERIGTDIREFVDEQARLRGAKFVQCLVAKDNTAGLESCGKQGYKLVAYQMQRQLG